MKTSLTGCRVSDSQRHKANQNLDEASGPQARNEEKRDAVLAARR